MLLPLSLSRYGLTTPKGDPLHFMWWGVHEIWQFNVLQRVGYMRTDTSKSQTSHKTQTRDLMRMEGTSALGHVEALGVVLARKVLMSTLLTHHLVPTLLTTIVVVVHLPDEMVAAHTPGVIAEVTGLPFAAILSGKLSTVRKQHLSCAPSSVEGNVGHWVLGGVVDSAAAVSLPLLLS